MSLKEKIFLLRGIKMLTKEELAPMIDHTNLNIDATAYDIEKLCQEAIDCKFGAVCVRLNMIPTVRSYLNIIGNGVNLNIAAVVGFPTKKASKVEEMIEDLSKYTIESKVNETKDALLRGANEIDMVIDISALKRENYDTVKYNIEAVVKAAKSYNTHNIVKVIVEAGFLTQPEKVEMCKIVQASGVDYIKTSTGFGISGATVEDIDLMAANINNLSVGIKASGGVQTIDFAKQLYEASQEYGQRNFRVGASKLAKEYADLR